MASFERASPALYQILLKIYYADKPIEIDHHLYEFGSIEYHVQASAADPNQNYLSISTPLLSHAALLSYGLSSYTLKMIKEACSNAVDIVEPPKEGYQLTLKLNFAAIPRGKDSEKVIRQISSVQAVILSSQLKEILQNFCSHDVSDGMYKPLKLIYHPRQPFYVIRKTQSIITVFPMRFKEHSDVIIATAFFQELMDVGSSEKWAKAPPCTWSPIPPPELRGEPIEDLSTNGGFVTFDISWRYIENKRIDKTVWSLLNFYVYVKNHIKCTKGFIQRRMQKRLESLVEVLQKENIEEEDNKKVKVKGKQFKNIRKLIHLPKTKTLKRRCGQLTKMIKRIRSRIKIHGFARFRRRFLTVPKFYSPMKYTKLK